MGQLLAAGLLGRGFALWTPHMSPANTTLLIRRLLEIVCTGENSTTRSEANAALLKVWCARARWRQTHLQSPCPSSSGGWGRCLCPCFGVLCCGTARSRVPPPLLICLRLCVFVLTQIGLAATQTLVSYLHQELSRASVTPYVRKAALSVIAQMCAKNPTGEGAHVCVFAAFLLLLLPAQLLLLPAQLRPAQASCVCCLASAGSRVRVVKSVWGSMEEGGRPLVFRTSRSHDVPHLRRCDRPVSFTLPHLSAVLPSLELMIGCLLKALDPRDSSRTQSLKEVSACLRVVLKNFPMTAYNKVGRSAARVVARSVGWGIEEGGGVSRSFWGYDVFGEVLGCISTWY